MGYLFKMELVSAVLKECSLNQYNSIFLEQGYDNIEYLRDLSRDEFALEMKELKMKKGEWRRLFRKLHKGQNAISPPPYQPPSYQPPSYEPPSFDSLYSDGDTNVVLTWPPEMDSFTSGQEIVILDKRKRKGRVEYLIKSNDISIWKSWGNIRGCEDIVKKCREWNKNSK